MIRALAPLALALALGLAAPADAGEAALDEMFEALREAGPSQWEALEDRIWEAWSHSGSDTLDLLLERGRGAIGEGAYEAAIEHLTVLVENAPDFAEGWNARATAYFHAGHYGPALADIARTLALEPRHFGALAGLGRILDDIGNPEAAIRVYRAALAIHPHHPDLREAVQSLEAELQGKTI